MLFSSFLQGRSYLRARQPHVRIIPDIAFTVSLDPVAPSACPRKVLTLRTADTPQWDPDSASLTRSLHGACQSRPSLSGYSHVWPVVDDPKPLLALRRIDQGFVCDLHRGVDPPRPKMPAARTASANASFLP